MVSPTPPPPLAWRLQATLPPPKPKPPPHSLPSGSIPPPTAPSGQRVCQLTAFAPRPLPCPAGPCRHALPLQRVQQTYCWRRGRLLPASPLPPRPLGQVVSGASRRRPGEGGTFTGNKGAGLGKKHGQGEQVLGERGQGPGGRQVEGLTVGVVGRSRGSWSSSPQPRAPPSCRGYSARARAPWAAGSGLGCAPVPRGGTPGRHGCAALQLCPGSRPRPRTGRGFPTPSHLPSICAAIPGPLPWSGWVWGLQQRPGQEHPCRVVSWGAVHTSRLQSLRTL